MTGAVSGPMLGKIGLCCCCRCLGAAAIAFPCSGDESKMGCSQAINGLNCSGEMLGGLSYRSCRYDMECSEGPMSSMLASSAYLPLGS